MEWTSNSLPHHKDWVYVLSFLCWLIPDMIPWLPLSYGDEDPISISITLFKIPKFLSIVSPFPIKMAALLPPPRAPPETGEHCYPHLLPASSSQAASGLLRLLKDNFKLSLSSQKKKKKSFWIPFFMASIVLKKKTVGRLRRF